MLAVHVVNRCVSRFITNTVKHSLQSLLSGSQCKPHAVPFCGAIVAVWGFLDSAKSLCAKNHTVRTPFFNCCWSDASATEEKRILHLHQTLPVLRATLPYRHLIPIHHPHPCPTPPFDGLDPLSNDVVGPKSKPPLTSNPKAHVGRCQPACRFPDEHTNIFVVISKPLAPL